MINLDRIFGAIYPFSIFALPAMIIGDFGGGKGEVFSFSTLTENFGVCLITDLSNSSFSYSLL